MDPRKLGIIAIICASTSTIAGTLSADQQNALVRKYCAVCHTDAADNGGLSLQHYDARSAAPSLSAMLLSKLSGGVALSVVQKRGSDPNAAALVHRKMRSGAMGAAGLPIPDASTVDAFADALASQANQAMRWSVSSDGAMTMASILREAPSSDSSNEAEAYRLVVSCDAATRQGTMQVAWSPVPQSGRLYAAVDGNPGVSYEVSGSEKMGNGSGVVTKGLAAIKLDRLPLPEKTLTIRDLFPGHVVVFPFRELPASARRSLAACSTPAAGQQ